MFKIGSKLKSIRLKNNLTIEELADRCELSKGRISQIERDLNPPSITTLINILEVLNTNLSDFFKAEKSPQYCFNNNDMYILAKDDYQIKWLVHNSSSNIMEPIILTLYPNKTSELIQPSDGEIFGYVLKGEVKVHYGSSESIIKKNDSFYIYCNKNHFLENISKENAEILWVSTPPKF